MRTIALAIVSSLCCALAAPAQTLPDQRALLVWQLHQVAGDDTIAELQSSTLGRTFLDTLEHNTNWMHDLLDSGPVHKGDVVLPYLFALWKDDPALVDDPVHRTMATACALAMGMRDHDPQWMTDRHDWFRDHWNDGLLNSGYGDLSTFERRFMARGLQRASWTDVEALAHLREEVCLPRQQYTGAAWRAPYRGHNAFGDTVQGPMYYMPFKGIWDSDAQMAIEVGGVCGALSHVGAAAAIANGIPALTMGEPGHCAYAVQTKPHTWQPAYSLSWKRGLHCTMTRSTWPSLEMAQAAHTDIAGARAAGDLRRAAQWYEAHGKHAQADRAWRDACQANPLDEHLWIAYARFGADNGLSAVWWNRLHDDVRTALLPAHPEPAWHLLKHHVYPGLLATAKGQRKRAAFKAFLVGLDGWGPVRWNVEDAFNWAWATAGDDTERRSMLADVLTHVIDDKAVGPAFVAWAHGKIGDNAQLAEAFETALLEQASDGDGEGREAVLKQLARTMLPAAAEQHDLDTFQRIGAKARVLYDARPPLAEVNIDPFSGTLLSSGGALRIFKPGNRWDSPEQHWGVLEEHGGWFHTDNGAQPWFEVELPGYGELTGIVLEGRNGHPGRIRGMRVLVSEDGQQWTQVAAATSGHSVQRFDLGATRPRARFVRFERDGKCMHFHRVLVYGEKAS